TQLVDTERSFARVRWCSVIASANPHFRFERVRSCTHGVHAGRAHRAHGFWRLRVPGPCERGLSLWERTTPTLRTKEDLDDKQGTCRRPHPWKSAISRGQGRRAHERPLRDGYRRLVVGAHRSSSPGWLVR